MTLKTIDSRGSAGRWLAVLGATAALAACGGGGGGGEVAGGEGTLRVALTDAPSCYENVFVTVEKVRVHQSGTAAEADGGWHELTLSPAKRIDLVTPNELQQHLHARVGQLILDIEHIRLLGEVHERAVAAGCDRNAPAFSAIERQSGSHLSVVPSPSIPSSQGAQ